ncbi:MAG: hypothetical protein GY940_23105 [bacterium]|nr:hypothetical protein [bacterium]
MKKTILYIIYICCLNICWVSMMVAQGNDPFNGTFSNAQITLSLQGANGQYRGNVRFEGQSYGVSARKANTNTIAGVYNYNGQNIQFQAVLQGTTLTIYSQGQSYILQRQGGASQPSQGMNPGASPTQRPASGGKGAMRNDEWGMTFKTPAGWTAKLTESGYVLGSNNQKGLMIILPHEAKSLQQLRMEAQQGLHEGNTNLNPSGALNTFGQNGIAGEFKGTLEGQQAQAYAIGLISPYGPGATILVAAEPQSFSNKHKESANQLARSIQFFKPPVSPVARQWKQTLSNCKLSYYSRYSSSGSGYTTETSIDLCAKGFFRYGNKDETVLNAVPGTVTGGYSMSYGKGSGTWSVTIRGQNVILVLKFYNNKVWEYTVTTDEKQRTYLNGKRYLRTCNPNDQVVEARPNCW